MARPEHLYVFAYDIARDRDRGRLSDLIGERLVRVQKSVFEGRLTTEAARALAQQAAVHLGPSDSLRVYCVTEAGRQASLAFGAAVLPEAGDFWLL